MFLLTKSVLFCLYSGDKLCSVEDCTPGTGVYLRHGYIYSSLAGYVLKKNEGEEVRALWLLCGRTKLQRHSAAWKCDMSLRLFNNKWNQMNVTGEVLLQCFVSGLLFKLPVISVVRETETQLLPDVGAIVTCKVIKCDP